MINAVSIYRSQVSYECNKMTFHYRVRYHRLEVDLLNFREDFGSCILISRGRKEVLWSVNRSSGGNLIRRLSLWHLTDDEPIMSLMPAGNPLPALHCSVLVCWFGLSYRSGPWSRWVWSQVSSNSLYLKQGVTNLWPGGPVSLQFSSNFPQHTCLEVSHRPSGNKFGDPCLKLFPYSCQESGLF